MIVNNKEFEQKERKGVGADEFYLEAIDKDRVEFRMGEER